MHYKFFSYYNEALKCKTLSAEVAHVYTLYEPFTLTTIYLSLTLVGVN